MKVIVSMKLYLPWLMIMAMLYFAIQGLKQRKKVLTALDRRNIAIVAAGALIIPIAMIFYLY